MSAREQRRAQLFARVVAGELKLWEAAVVLGLSIRQAHRLKGALVGSPTLSWGKPPTRAGGLSSVCRVLQGPAQPTNDRGDLAGADRAASAGARCSNRWCSHEVALHQLQSVQSWE